MVGSGAFGAAPPQKQKENEVCRRFYKQATPLGFEAKRSPASPRAIWLPARPGLSQRCRSRLSESQRDSVSKPRVARPP
jgi:hypothetical protein